MKSSILAVLLVASIACSQAASLRRSTALNQANQEIQQVGRAVLRDALIQTSSKLPENDNILAEIMDLIDAGAPVDRILELMDSIRDDTEDEQRAHDEKNAADTAKCERDEANERTKIANYNANIEHLSSVIEIKTDKIERLEGELATKRNQIATTERNIENNEALNVQVEDRRAREISFYEANKADHEEAIRAVIDVTERIYNLGNIGEAASLLEQSLLSISSRPNSKAGNLMSNTVDMLRTMAAVKGPQNERTLVDLLNRLRSELEGSLEDLAEADSSNQAAYEAEIADIVAEHATLVSVLAQLNSQRESLEAELSQTDRKSVV